MHSLTFENNEPDWVDPEIGLRLGSYRDRVDNFALGRGFARGGVLLRGPKAIAYVNHGRWVADCPLNDGGARVVSPDYEFWCIECGNTFQVEWPDKKTMRDITTVLEQRPDRTTQNFNPTDFAKLHPANQSTHEPCPDPVVYLAYENDLRGIPVGNDIIKRRYEKWLQADWTKRGLAKEMAGFNVESK